MKLNWDIPQCVSHQLEGVPALKRKAVIKDSTTKNINLQIYYNLVWNLGIFFLEIHVFFHWITGKKNWKKALEGMSCLSLDNDATSQSPL